MSSRSGPRASGTDGSDFSHREKVASHYKDSVRWKSKLKLNLLLNLLCVVLGVIWSALGHFKMVQYQPQDWHLAWLCTCIPVMFGINSLQKNRQNQMYVYVFGSLVLGFGSMLYGATKYLKVVMVYMQQDSRGTLDLRGLSIKLAVVGLIVQMQITALYYAIRLIGAWKSKGEKKDS